MITFTVKKNIIFYYLSKYLIISKNFMYNINNKKCKNFIKKKFSCKKYL